MSNEQGNNNINTTPDGRIYDQNTGGLVQQNQNQMGSFTNHGSVATSTQDAANILVYQQEARVKKQLSEVKRGRSRIGTELEQANNDARNKVDSLGADFNKHVHALFKKFVDSLNSDDSKAIACLLNLIGVKHSDQRFTGNFDTNFEFDGDRNEVSIRFMSATVNFNRRKSIAESSTEAHTTTVPMPQVFTFNTEQMPDIIKEYPQYFPADFQDKIKTIQSAVNHARNLRSTVSKIDSEIARLNDLLTQIPSLERAARATIAEGQMESSGQTQLLQLLKDRGNGLAEDLLGGGESEFLGDNGQFRLPVANLTQD